MVHAQGGNWLNGNSGDKVMNTTHATIKNKGPKHPKVDFGDYIFYPNEASKKSEKAYLKFKKHDYSEDSYVMRRRFRHLAQDLRNHYS
jgi:hypothetical protein